MGSDHSPGPEDDFEARLRRAREAGGSRKGNSRGPVTEGIGAAIRIGVELVAALMVGVFIGYLLDLWLGTAPWMMVVFFFLGSAAGVLNVYRAASGIGLAPGYRRPGETPDKGGETPEDDDQGRRS